MVMDTRAQVFTLEGLVAALLVLSSVIFVLGVTAATPLSASTSNQHVENQQAAVTTSLLDAAAANDSLRPTVLHWDDALGSFHATSSKGYYTTCAFDTAFGRLLETTFEDRNIACNVDVRYVTPDGDVRTRQLVYVGEPTDNAVRATATVTLYDDDEIRLADGSNSGRSVENSSHFVPDAAPGSRLYNVVEVEVIVWRL